jgi:hypothetical protein
MFHVEQHPRASAIRKNAADHNANLAHHKMISESMQIPKNKKVTLGVLFYIYQFYKQADTSGIVLI